MAYKTIYKDGTYEIKADIEAGKAELPYSERGPITIDLTPAIEEKPDRIHKKFAKQLPDVDLDNYLWAGSRPHSRGLGWILRRAAAEVWADAVADHEAYKTERAELLKANVPGLDKLRTAYRHNRNAYKTSRRAIEETSRHGYTKTKIPEEIDTDALRAKYPRAALYLKAEDYIYASHHSKVSAGKKAMEILHTGGTIEDAKQALDWTTDSMKWD